MKLDAWLGQLRSAAGNPPKMKPIRVSNPGGRRTRQSALTLARAQEQQIREVADEARRKVTPT